MDKFENITYETVGIDPATFYRGKFAGKPCRIDHLAGPCAQYDIELDRARFLVGEIRGPVALDLGCGSGPYGVTIKSHTNVTELVGVDLDRKCCDIARQSGYDFVRCFDLKDQLPFEDSTFDTVFSVDFFGHVEFKYKDSLIRELHRVTKPGGKSVHVIEAGILDYDAIDPNDPNDPVLRIVNFEGHIGIESHSDIRDRWKLVFSRVMVENGLIYPFTPIEAYIHGDEFPIEIREIFKSFDVNQRLAAHVAIGFLHNFIKSHVREHSPELLQPDHRSKDILKRPGGLAYLVAEKGP